MSNHSFTQATGYVSLFTLVLSCSSYSATIVKAADNDAGIGGGSAAGGSSSTASTNNAGTSTTGGTTSSGANSTVDPNVIGGASNTGGTVTSGGASAAGGSAATAGAFSTGGVSAAGGLAATGGVPSIGGSATTGGAFSTGGVSAAGGSAATGGAFTVGGSGLTGGSAPLGSSAYCTINSVIYADGARNPNDKCQSCQTAISTALWVALSEGASCDSTKVCHAGNCQTGCWIESQYYAEGASRSNVPCMTCQPTVSPSAWTPNRTNCGCTGDFETVDTKTGLCVAKMATIPATSTSEEFSIDMTEVTQGQYDGWLATNPTLPTSTDTNCSWNTTYAEQGVGFTGADAAHHPVVYVDWCDANAYCAGVGKRLCGAIAGGAIALGDFEKGQWYYACSLGGTTRYPYGSTYQSTYCRDSDVSTGTYETVVVGSLPNCVTAGAGARVYDLTGNVTEWLDNCGTGPMESCMTAGGAYDSDALSLGYGCSFIPRHVRNEAHSDLGFRCCSL